MRISFLLAALLFTLGVWAHTASPTSSARSFDFHSSLSKLLVGIVLLPPPRAIAIDIHGRWIARGDGGAPLLRLCHGDRVFVSADGGLVGFRRRGEQPRRAKMLVLQPQRASPFNRSPSVWQNFPQENDVLTIRGRAYSGPMRFFVRKGVLQPVLELPLEQYVRDVVASEMPPHWPLQAQAAQAVVCRSYALSMMGRHRSEGYDVCSLTHCQLYQCHRPSARADEAVRITRGWILLWRGLPAVALYHSCCGGITACSAGEPKPAGTEYLRSVQDRLRSNGEWACARSPWFRWKTVLNAGEMKAVLREAGLPLQGQEVGAVKVASRDESGRVLQLQVNGTRISGTRFWLCAGRALGRRRICSTLFHVRKQGSSYIFEGRGYGHGAGLCQWGAKALAESGMTWPQILKRYYPALQLSSTPPKLDYVQPGYYH